MIEKIKKEIQKRMGLANGMIEIVMKKSGDVVIITADADASDPETIFEMKGYKLQPICVRGLDNLAVEIANYDKAVEKQQGIISNLYAFKREKIDTGVASQCEKAWYADTFEEIFGYRPSMAA